MHDKLKQVIQQGFVCRALSRLDDREEMPSCEVTENNMYHLRALDLPMLHALLEADNFNTSELGDNSTHWKIKTSRITLLLRYLSVAISSLVLQHACISYLPSKQGLDITMLIESYCL